MELGSVPQWITAIIAFLAFCAAIASILVQKAIARRRAALDFFIKTETDKELLNAYTSFNDALEKAQEYPSGDELISADSQTYSAICDYLAIHELMALGVREKVFDDKICRRFWANVLEAAVSQASHIIDHVRAQPLCENTYDDLLGLHKEWQARKGK